MNPTLKNKAMIVTCSVGTWTARKLDRKVSDEIARQNLADLDSGRYNKQLIPAKSPSYLATTKAASAVRNLHYALTLPWTNMGQILPSANYMDYTSKMNSAIQAFESTLQPFFDDYSTLVSIAQSKLGSLFNTRDYPTVDAIRRKYYARYEIAPMADSADFRVALADDELKAVKDSYDAYYAAGNAATSQAAWNRIYTAVNHMAETLADPEKGFHGSLVGNLQDLVDLLPGFNLNNDPNMEAMRRAIESQLIHDTKDLKKDKAFRASVAADAKAIGEQIKGFSSGVTVETTPESDVDSVMDAMQGFFQ